MKKACLLFSLLIALCIVACKKNDKVTSQTDKTDSDQGGTNQNPNVTDDHPKLLNLRINGAQCAYDSIGKAYYFPVSMGVTLTSYKVNFDSTAAASVYINNSKLHSGDVADFPLQTNQTVEIDAASTVGATTVYNLIITGVPMVMIRMKKTSDIIDSLQKDGTIDVIDPDFSVHKVSLQTHSNITIATRGATARNLIKKSYKVNTVDGSDNASDLPILGLRNDEDWILDAMYIDPARMRNRLCTDLWNSFNNVPYAAQEPDALNGTRGYMTEVFLNGKYAGVYCLTEKLDRKQLKVKKVYGMVYKSDVVTPQSAFTKNQAFTDGLATWGGWEFSYPNFGDTPAPTWGYLSNIIDFVANSSDVDFVNGIQDHVDINNLVDYFIFMNAIDATDNFAKNQYFSFYDYRTNSKFFYSPWDMDGTMGRDWAGTTRVNEIVGYGDNNLFHRLVSLNAANFKDLVKTRWAVLKNNQLSKATIDNRIEYYRQLLVGSGAFDREYKFTGNVYQTLNQETQYMVRWYSYQYDMVDQYFNGL
jgi:spore coat protein CotH